MESYMILSILSSLAAVVFVLLFTNQNNNLIKRIVDSLWHPKYPRNGGSGSYKRIHQREDQMTGVWESYDASENETDPNPFVAYVRHKSRFEYPRVDVHIDVRSQHLKKALRSCLQYVDSVHDLNPLVKGFCFGADLRSLDVNCILRPSRSSQGSKN